jgi:hypothetical protein
MVRGRPVARPVAIAGLCYLLIALLVTARLWTHPSTSIVPGNPSDADQSAWFFAYDATAFAHLRLPGLITTAMNAPQGISVMWNTFMLLPGVLLAPVTLLAGAQTSLTVLLTLGFAGSATALFAVLCGWGVPARFAALGGFAYGFAPALLQSSMGHYDLQFAVLPPLIASAALRLFTRPRVRTGLWLGALATAQIFIAEELLFDTTIAVLIALVVLALSRPRRVLPVVRVARQGMVAALAVVAVVAGYPLWTQFFGPLRATGSPFLADWFKNDLSGLVEPSSQEWLHTSSSAAFAATSQAGAPEYLAYLGWPMLIVMAVFTAAFWRVLAIRVTAVAYIVLTVFSLGGTLLSGQHEHSWLKLPWYWFQTLPISGSVLPDRFSIIADVAAGAPLAFGLAEWARRSPRWAQSALAVGVISVIPLIPRPLPASTVATPPAGWRTAFSRLHLPSEASVLVVPIPTATFTEPLRWQAETGDPSSVVGGYFMGPAWNGHIYIDGDGLTTDEQYLNQLWSRSSGQSTGSQPIASVPSVTNMRVQIAELRPAAVVAVTSERTTLGRFLISVLGKPSVVSGDVLAWRR